MRRYRSRYNDYGYAPYVTVAEKQARSEAMSAKLKKKNPDLAPVVIAGQTIAKSWWGKSWNKNIERYADYAYRLDRGRSYVRSGCVLDLQITSGKVNALVAGSRGKPYEINVKIAPLSREHLTRISDQVKEKLHSLSDLLAGKFPADLQSLFFEKESGLFPQPTDISFSCSCPDWAKMCKHVAATLYGVGARLDEEPALFFTLRHIDQSALVGEVLASQADTLLEKAARGAGRRRRLADSDVTTVFNVDLQPPSESPAPEKTRVPRKKSAKKTTKKSAPRKTTKKKTAKKETSKKAAKKKARG